MTEVHVIAADPPAPDDGAEPVSARLDAIQQRVHELASKAQSFLNRPTNANYKQALGLYERILGFSDIDAPQRDEYGRRLAEVRAAYEQFRAQFGELTTARQLQRDEVELVELRKLINSGVEHGPDGEELEPQFDKLLATVREKLLRVGRELADQAGKQATDGADYLDTQLIDAAAAGFEQAVRRIQGDEIQLGDAAPATGVAVTGIKSLLLNDAAQTAIKKYDQRAAGIRDSRVIIQRIRPMYDEADLNFRQGAYAQSVALLELVHELVSKQFASLLIDSLWRRAVQRWEQATLARADTLLQSAKIAASRSDYEQVERVVGELIGLEPHLDTPALKERKAQAEELVKQLQDTEWKLQQLVGESGLARVRGDLPEAERLAREALVLRPGHRPAQHALDTLLTLLVNAALRGAEDALASPDDARLNASRDALELQRQYLGEISDAASRRKLAERLEETLAQIKQAADQQRQTSDRDRLAQSLIERALGLAQQERFADALAVIAEARELAPQSDALAAHERELRGQWAAALRQHAREFMEASPPHPSAALDCLNTLRGIGMEDVGSVELRRRAEWSVSNARGLGFLNQAMFAEAIDALLQSDLGDPHVRAALAGARAKEAQRLMNLGRWGVALDTLQQIDAPDHEVLALVSRARAEHMLDQAAGFFNLKVFDGAEARLREAEREPLDDIPGRVAQLRDQIGVAHEVFRKAHALQQRAQEQYRRFRSYTNPNDLLEAIRTLDEALDLGELPIEDRQRASIQKLRSDYGQQYQDIILAERARLLAEGDQALEEERVDRIPDAIQRYKAVLALAPNHQDTEALDRLERARHLLNIYRDRLIDEAGLLLNMRGSRTGQRGVRMVDIQALLARLEKAQQIDTEPHRALNDTILALQAAARAYQAAEPDVQAARSSWQTLRQTGSNQFTDVEHALQRALRYFEGLTYIHSDLDRNDPESLVRQIGAERDLRRAIGSASASAAQALAQGDGETLAVAFAELARTEEALFNSGVSFVGAVSSASAPPARYPQQYALLNALASQIQQYMQREREAPDIQQLRDVIQHRTALQRLLERLDRDNRFGLR